MPGLIDQPTKVPTRKVLAVIWVLVGAMAMLVGLICVRVFLIPDDPALDALINAVGTAIPLLIAALVASYQTRNVDATTPPRT